MAKNLSNFKGAQAGEQQQEACRPWYGFGHGQNLRPRHKASAPFRFPHDCAVFEGGQMPLHRRLPKRGFTNIFRTELLRHQPGPHRRLQAEGHIRNSPWSLRRQGPAQERNGGLVKVLATVSWQGAVTVHAHKFSKWPGPGKDRKKPGARRSWLPNKGCGDFAKPSPEESRPLTGHSAA